MATIRFGGWRGSWGNKRNSTAVCPECRFTSRGTTKLCPKCGRPLIGIGEKLRVPKKHDEDGWKRFLKKVCPRQVFPREKTAVVIDKGTPEDFKECVHDYLSS